ncbi:hypothetical protein PSHT_09674 [Puccinia striiformis]|uniref:Uncharacterized protein n=1 Tax=Puccinia striiformis TaxID=27350 RepID=A0A2S4VFA5_9BASI|nr:hypothetical protein PSHT_09674 [Puccinia striiformis]
MPLILNQPEQQQQHHQPQQLIHHQHQQPTKKSKSIPAASSSKLLLTSKPTTIHTDFTFIPLNEPNSVMEQPPSPNRHPTYLLNHFPHRPHQYLPDSVGAQEGYCLSPIPSSLPTINTSSSSSSSSSSPPFSSTRPEITLDQSLQNTLTLSEQLSSSSTYFPTKKVLPTPPSLSIRVRKIFMDKIGSQQAQSCAQLPRRKKKINTQSNTTTTVVVVVPQDHSNFPPQILL